MRSPQTERSGPKPLASEDDKRLVFFTLCNDIINISIFQLVRILIVTGKIVSREMDL